MYLVFRHRKVAGRSEQCHQPRKQREHAAEYHYNRGQRHANRSIHTPPCASFGQKYTLLPLAACRDRLQESALSPAQQETSTGSESLKLANQSASVPRDYFEQIWR